MPKDYQWLRDQCQNRLTVHEDGYKPREIIGPGGKLFDAVLGWIEPDGSVILNDIGGQKNSKNDPSSFDPEEGHGGLFRLRRDDTLEDIVPHGNMGRWVPFSPVLAPAYFPKWAGHSFFVGQTYPGREGARKDHAVFKHAPGEDRVTLFADVPHVGTINNGVPAAMVMGGFGLPGTKFENKFFCQSLVNCTIYTVDPAGNCEPFMTMAPPLLPYTVMPNYVCVAPEWFGPLAGQMMVQGMASGTYLHARRVYTEYKYWWIRPDGSLDPNPIKVPTQLRPDCVAKAPKEFGRFADHIFWAEDGPTNLMHVTMSDDGPLPYGGRIWRMDPRGDVYLFADNFQTGFTGIGFDKDRLIAVVMRKSYSTGAYHEPDSSVYEIKSMG